MQKYITLLSALCAVLLFATTLASARRGGDDNNDSNGNSNSRRCRERFGALCVEPCRNSSSGILDMLDCQIDCFRDNAASLAGCRAPTIPRDLLRRTNCSEVFRHRCDECSNSTGLEELSCANTCVRNRLASFRECRHGAGEFFGDRNITNNCTREIRGRCQRCLRGSLNMEEKTACLVKCVADPQIRGNCNKTRDDNNNGGGNPPLRNCTEAFAQCPACVGLIGRARLQCLSDCDVVRNNRGCFLGPLTGIPGLGGNALCHAAVNQNCNACATVPGGVREQLKCLRDCIEDQRACNGRDQRDCIESICATCRRLPGNQRRACIAQCVVNKAEEIAECVTGV